MGEHWVVPIIPQAGDKKFAHIPSARLVKLFKCSDFYKKDLRSTPGCHIDFLSSSVEVLPLKRVVKPQCGEDCVMSPVHVTCTPVHDVMYMSPVTSTYKRGLLRSYILPL